MASGTFPASPPVLGAAAAFAGRPEPIPPTIPSATSAKGSEALIHSRASFWLRMGAGVVDLVLVGILCGVLDHLFTLAGNLESALVGRRVVGSWLRHEPWFLVLTVAYFTAMWTWKGTTVGGIVTGLKVARLDGQPLSFVVALVRALAAWFSAVFLFLGFFWIAWDRESQGWHDKIAGTVVLRLPRATPLVCI